jgi:hypothetical protein
MRFRELFAITKVRLMVLGFTLILLVFIGCIKTDTSKEKRGYLNLTSSFVMKTYPNVTDTQCGCPSEKMDIHAYWGPEMIIKNEQGVVVYSNYYRNTNLIQFPLLEGRYSIQFKMKVKELLSCCDSARDIWKAEVFPGQTVYCVNKMKYNYKDIDSTEYFEIKRELTSTLKRDF